MAEKSVKGRDPIDIMREKEIEAETILKQVLKVTVVGYGEKRDSRIAVSIDKETKKRAMKKCKQLGCSLSEAVNQLLFIWSKDKQLPIIRGGEADSRINTSIEKAGKDNRTNITLEKTTKEKADLKCKRLNCALSEVVNGLLFIWSREVQVPDEPLDELEPNMTEQSIPKENFHQQSLFDIGRLNGDHE